MQSERFAADLDLLRRATAGLAGGFGAEPRRSPPLTDLQVARLVSRAEALAHDSVVQISEGQPAEFRAAFTASADVVIALAQRVHGQPLRDGAHGPDQARRETADSAEEEDQDRSHGTPKFHWLADGDTGTITAATTAGGGLESCAGSLFEGVVGAACSAGPWADLDDDISPGDMMAALAVRSTRANDSAGFVGW